MMLSRYTEAFGVGKGDPEARLGREAVAQAAAAYAEVYLGGGGVAAARAMLGLALEFSPDLGIGMLVCDLLLGQDTDLELDLTQEQADLALRHWVEVLRPTPLFDLFVALAPAIEPMFPWLGEAI